jgi:hypothetical protein
MNKIKCKFFMICFVASIVCLQQLQTLANSVTVGDYTLTVSKGSPAYSPEAPTTSDKLAKQDRRINVNFSLKIEKRTARGSEDISVDVKNCSYEMTSSTGTCFYEAIPSSLLPPTTTDNHYICRNKKFYPNVTHILVANTVGTKTVIMKVTVTMKDGTVLTTLATNTFEVCEYVITVYSFVGDINNQLVADGYVYDTRSIGGDAILKKSIGHATWQVEIDDPSKLSSTTRWAKYVNIPCGFSVTFFGQNTFVANLRTYPASGLSVDAPGYLHINDGAGGTNKQFKMTKVQAEAALDKTLNIDTTKPIIYVLHSNNCVDASMAVASAGGVTFKTNCRHSVTFVDATHAKSGDISLPSELENELK